MPLCPCFSLQKRCNNSSYLNTLDACFCGGARLIFCGIFCCCWFAFCFVFHFFFLCLLGANFLFAHSFPQCFPMAEVLKHHPGCSLECRWEPQAPHTAHSDSVILMQSQESAFYKHPWLLLGYILRKLVIIGDDPWPWTVHLSDSHFFCHLMYPKPPGTN